MNPQPVNEKIERATDRAADAVRSAADSTLQGAQTAISGARAGADKVADKTSQVAQQTRDAANAQLDRAAHAVDAMRGDIDPTINELAAKAQALAERSINYCAHTGERLRQQVDNYTQATTRYVVDQPAKSMLIAFGSGAALATLLILATRGRRD
jgi:ElaB/YqjD/DUF883 family membrane-anchored ribosome-binding protein